MVIFAYLSSGHSRQTQQMHVIALQKPYGKLQREDLGMDGKQRQRKPGHRGGGDV